MLEPLVNLLRQARPLLVQGAWRLFGALIGLILGGGLALLLGDAIAKALVISNFEGGRGYFIVFALVPLLALIGAVLGAIMIYMHWRFNLLVILTLLILVGGFMISQRDQFIDPPPLVEALGNFAILTHTSENMGDYYTLRYRGEPFTFEGRAGMFGDETASYETMNAVITFTLPISITEPAFVVNVGDPNNSSFFYLVREVDGRAKVDHLSDTHGNVAADWLDAGLSDATAPRDLTLHRGRLAGGRWLLLGDNCVLDVQTLTAYGFDTYPLQDGSDAALNQFKLPLGLSPDQHSFVRIGSSEVRDRGTDKFRGYMVRLIVYDFVDGASYTLPVDRLLMRYPAIEEIDAAWLDHHFVWQQTDGAHERLVQRADFTPLPYYGRLSGEGQDQEYNLVPIKSEMLDKVAGFLEQKFQAVRQGTVRYDANVYIDFQLGEQTIHAGYFSDNYAEPHVGVWLEWQSGQDGKLIEAIARRFDEVLKTGVYDGLFLGDPVAVTAPVIEGVEQFTDLARGQSARRRSNPR